MELARQTLGGIAEGILAEMGPFRNSQGSGPVSAMLFFPTARAAPRGRAHPGQDTTMDAKQLAKLIRKNTETVQRTPKGRDPRSYDQTLPVRVDDDAAAERAKLFDEMKKREF
ncbi:MAG TPA: hypothetical protein VK922_15505 [Gemmatimonadaceae bacterium]|nr:hypothetical protein [Gemmatimonadaceae bacterium]